MIQIDVYDVEGILTGFKAKGHAGNNQGEYDLVCAAVSILTQTCVESLHQVAGLAEKDIPYQMEDGFLSVEIDPATAEDKTIQIIFQTMVCGLEMIEKTARPYLKITGGKKC